MVTIYHVDVVAYVAAIYARRLVRRPRLSAITRVCGVHRRQTHPCNGQAGL